MNFKRQYLIDVKFHQDELKTMQVFPRIYKKCYKNAQYIVNSDQYRAIMGFDDNILIIKDFQLAKINLTSLFSN